MNVGLRGVFSLQDLLQPALKSHHCTSQRKEPGSRGEVPAPGGLAGQGRTRPCLSGCRREAFSHPSPNSPMNVRRACLSLLFQASQASVPLCQPLPVGAPGVLSSCVPCVPSSMNWDPGQQCESPPVLTLAPLTSCYMSQVPGIAP